MAFMRDYAAASGDPFRFRLPKKLRKWKPGRSIAGLARAGIGLIPGGGTALSMFDRGQQMMDVARSYGYAGDPDDDVDDYMGDPKGKAPKPAKKRKSAGAGPAAKAAKKKQKRRERHNRNQRSDDRAAEMWSALKDGNVIGAVTGEIQSLMHGGKQQPPMNGGGPPDIEMLMRGAPGRRRGRGGFPGMGHRRTLNPANVKALRRSMRRVEGFQKLVKRVEHAFPMMRRAHAASSAGGHSRGHKSGCGCVVCKRGAR